MNCPKDCSRSGASWQSRLTMGEIRQVPVLVAPLADYRCAGCGCVYDYKGESYGFLSDGIWRAGAVLRGKPPAG